MKKSQPRRKTKGNSVLDSPRDTIAYDLRDSYRAMARAFQIEIEHSGITIGMWMFLRALWQQDGLTQKDLINSSGLMQPGTSAALKQMERRGLVKQVIDAEDRRKVRVLLTPKSRSLLAKLLPVAAKVRDLATSDFSEQEVAMLRDLLGRIRSNVEGSVQSQRKARSARE